MHTRTSTRMLIIAVVSWSLTALASADTSKPPAKPGPTDAELIKSAMSAAPAAVGKKATVVVMESDGKMRTVRKGTNGFTCMPDNPATPGPDPMCMDANAMEWVHAWVAHKAPPTGKVGLMYMLEGGTDAATPIHTRRSPRQRITGSRPGRTSWSSAPTQAFTTSIRRRRIRIPACRM